MAYVNAPGEFFRSSMEPRAIRAAFLRDSQPTAISEADASRLQGRSMGYALLCSSRVALVLLLFSSYSARLIPAGRGECPGRSIKRRRLFDSHSLIDIQSIRPSA